MGQTLSSPATHKKSQSGSNSRFAYSISEMQGWRITMEDAHAIVLELEEGQTEPNSFFAVYDGHGGGTVAKFAGHNVHKRLVEEETYSQKNYETAMKRAFLGTDEDLLSDPAHTRDPSGCTANAALITHDNKIYVANAGDSRSVISIKGKVEPLSFDHKPTNPTEKARISAAGGYIEFGRVNGNLALSRALGDFEFKKNYSLTPEKQVITADPDVTCHEITDEDEFLIVACDGIWDCMSSQQAVDYVRRMVAQGQSLTEICEAACEYCLAPDTTSGAGIGCDNMTILVIAILHGRTLEEWYAWVKDRVEKNYGYVTPAEPPQLYSAARIRSFEARRAATQARERQREEYVKKAKADNGDALPEDDSDGEAEVDDGGFSSFLASSGLGGFTRVLGSTGGISFHPGSGIMSNGNLMFGSTDEDSDEDDRFEEEDEGNQHMSGIFGSRTYGLGAEGEEPDLTKSLKAQLDELERDIQDQNETHVDGDSSMEEISIDSDHPTKDQPLNLPPPDAVQGEAPPPPTINGDIKAEHDVQQLAPIPKPDSPLKEGDLLDKGEDPLKV